MVSVDDVRDLCNQGKALVDEALKENKTLDSDFLGWDKTMTDKAVSLALLSRVKRLLTDFERVGGKLEVIRDMVLVIKAEGKGK